MSPTVFMNVTEYIFGRRQTTFVTRTR